ncbi:MAG: Transcription termination/antitermination protein NusA [Verrucomicrobiae bacterium]|nr:Transcription termination/antitermination protein NusA [Verrucomicrobiae bacterium]
MNGELIAVLEYLQREKGIDKEVLIVAVEQALLQASKKSVGPAKDLRIEIDRKSGAIRAIAQQTVVETVVNKLDEISLADARKKVPNAQLGESVEIEVTPANFGRIAAQTAKQAMLQKIRQVEKDMVFEEFKGRAGDIISGTVRRFERSDVLIDLGRIEAIMPSRERVPTEEYQPGDRIRAYILSVDNAGHGAEIILSRSHPDFVKKLFELEVTEIADKTVEIKGIAREAGFRSKLAVWSRDEKVDPVGACVGMKGMRVKNIVRELSGEKIDIIRWDPNVRQFVANALAPAKLKNLVIDEARHSVKIIVDSDQLSLAIGKKGQNARLTSKLTGWSIDIEKEETAELGFEAKVARAVKEIAAIPGIEREVAEKLVKLGFHSLEGLLGADETDLSETLGEESAKAVCQAVATEQERREKTAEEPTA